MADGSFPGLVSRNRDVNADDNVIFTGITDDAGNLVSVTGNKLDVNAAVTVASDHIYVDDTAFTVAVDSIAGVGYLFDDVAPDSVDEGDIGIGRMTADRSQHVTIRGGANPVAHEFFEATTAGDQGLALLYVDITGNEYIPISGNDQQMVSVFNPNMKQNGQLYTLSDSQNPHDKWVANVGGVFDDVSTDTLGENELGYLRLTSKHVLLSNLEDASGNRLVVNSDGSINVIVNQNVSATEIHDYDTASAIASDAVSNHDYTIANTTMLLKSVIVSGSGNIKFEVQTGELAGLATRAVGFLTGRQGDTKQLFFDPPIEVPVTGTGTVRVIRTNRQGAATDLYSTIIGNDV